ncbi:MAG: hypothetical protein Kow0099_14920 [Candidatus Abyssubacteria bacterium]
MRIAVFSSIPWDFLKQRPQALATELANMGHEVYYMEPFMFNRCPGCLVREARKSTRLRPTSHPRLNLFSSPFFWSTTKYARYFPLNGLLSRRIVRFLRKSKIDFAIIQDAGYVDTALSSGIPFAYDHVDDMQHMDAVPKDYYLEKMARVKETSVFNIYTQPMHADEDAKGLCIPNGCYPGEFFPVEARKDFDAVFIGCLARWCDMDSILRSNKRILLIGPMDVVDEGDNLQKYLNARKNNIYYIPTISKEVANLWLNSARVGLVPFKEDHPVVQYAMPVKILEYFLCELPVVTFRNAGIELQYGDRVVYYSSIGNGRSLDDAIDIALQAGPKHEYREFAEQYAWPRLVEKLDERIRQHIV